MASFETPGLTVLLAAFRALSSVEQDEAIARLAELRTEREAGSESETARFVRSMRMAVEFTGKGGLAPGDYDAAREQLLEEGVELAPRHSITRFFGTWRRAKEALSLSEITTARRIDARFKSRALGKVWRYSEADLRAWVEKAMADIGHVPELAEFEAWRLRQLELAQAEGRELHIPGGSPYRRRYGMWVRALLHFGYVPDIVAEREPSERAGKS